MNRDVLRASLFVLGVLTLAGAVAVAGAGCALGLTLRLALPGLLLIGALLIERWRYKRLTADRPGPGWVVSGERFVDPETGRHVTVYVLPATGERRYVSNGPSAPNPSR
jgi:hypothetical protein